ncbi:hypothetical protein BBW65_02010 [Helicobacter enhydrae]|uniref:Sulfurtransferase-like selenium metabolism protein YedF n=1 Tax=Helicobacter enhydrae TaxID=222136 RepID=A0A1B1U4D2_9HELI|nr:sulfurtransferase-like selenium metabolism protein YedF [Helicobacter enhydrae]ANV97654.1 hypothetical protein BBW65_02010 [Helicobacter enhydrae]
MKQVQIDITQALCTDAVSKIQNVLAKLRQNNIAVSQIVIIADTQKRRDETIDFLFAEGYLFQTEIKEGEFWIHILGRDRQAPTAPTPSSPQATTAPTDQSPQSTPVSTPPPPTPPKEPDIPPNSEFENKIFIFTSDRIGEGDLGEKLLEGLLHNLYTTAKIPRELIFINRGVLACIDVEKNLHITRTLKKLEQRGVAVSTCGTCLEYYNVRDLLCVGSVSNSAEITRKMLRFEVVTF